jgi:hypothetical protein
MSKSEQHLRDAFAGESQANRKYLAFASLRRLIKRAIHRLPSFFGLRGRLKPFMPTLICALWEKLEKLWIILRWQ